MDEHKKKLRRNRCFIVENLLCIDEVLDHSLGEAVLSASAVDEIRCKRERRQQIRFILDVLEKKGADIFEKFCSVLDQTNNEMIASKLRTSSSPTPPFRKDNNDCTVAVSPKRSGKMSDEDREMFQRLHVEFVENMLDVEGVVDNLMEQELIGSAHRSSIFIDNDRRAQVRRLMTFLPKKGSRVLPVLLTAFERTGNDHLFHKIKDYKKHHPN